MSTEVKQEGEFKIKKRTPKKLIGNEEVIKVDLSKPLVEPKKEETKDAVQEQSADEISIRDESKTSEGIQKQDNQEANEKSSGEDNSNDEIVAESPIEVIEDEENNSEETRVAGSDEATVATSEQKEILQ